MLPTKPEGPLKPVLKALWNRQAGRGGAMRQAGEQRSLPVPLQLDSGAAVAAAARLGGSGRKWWQLGREGEWPKLS